MELWYAVRVRSNQEKMVHASLVAKGIEAFLPTYRRSMRWSDRMKMLETPLFPGYVFGRFDAVRRLPILLTPGVVHILGNSTGPLPVDDD